MKTSKALLIVLSYIALMLTVTQCNSIKNKKAYSGVKMCPSEFNITLEKGSSIEKDIEFFRETKTSAEISEVWIPNNLSVTLPETGEKIEGFIIPNSWINLTSGFEKGNVGTWQTMKFKVTVPATAKPGFYISAIAVNFENAQGTFFIDVILTVIEKDFYTWDNTADSGEYVFQNTPHEGEIK